MSDEELRAAGIRFERDVIVPMRDGTKLRLSRNFREEFLGRMLGDQSESGERRIEE